MTLTARKRALFWIVPVVTVGAAWLLTRLFSSFRDHTPLFLFLAAVTISTWYGGWPSGTLATLLAGFATARSLGPTYNSAFDGNSKSLLWLLFMLTTSLISFAQVVQSRLKRRLRTSEERLALALDSSGCGVWDYNLLTGRFWWSKNIETIFGRFGANFARTYEEFLETIHIEDQPLFNRVMTRMINEGGDYEVECRILHPDNSIRRVNIRGRIFYNDASQVERIVGLTTDITDRKPLHVSSLNDCNPAKPERLKPTVQTAPASQELVDLQAKSAH